VTKKVEIVRTIKKDFPFRNNVSAFGGGGGGGSSQEIVPK